MTRTTDHDMECGRFDERLSAYLEHELDAPERVAMDDHALSCDRCAALLADIAAIRADAAELPPLLPERDLWAGIADRIAAPVIALDERAPRRVDAIARSRRWLRPALAAAGLVIATAAVTHLATRAALEGRVAAPATMAAVSPVATTLAPVVVPALPPAIVADAAGAGGSTARAVAPSRPTRVTAIPIARRAAPLGMEDAYGREISRLRTLVSHRRAQLDPETIAVVEQNLAIIDTAIARSRAALRRDPASGFLTEQLNRALEQKVELLRTAATLPIRAS
jgi:anti-sigma factor ChrR (cupin superfamily)